MSASLASDAERIKAEFRSYDSSGDGFISEKALRGVFRLVVPDLEVDRLAPLFARCRGGDGMVHYSDFLDRLFQPTSKVPTGTAGAARDQSRPVAIRQRLVSFGQTLSVEVGPSDVAASGSQQAGAKKKKPTLLDLQGGPEPLPQGTLVYVNMVRPAFGHFADVASSTSAIAFAGLRPVPHVPAARFSNTSEFSEVLSMLTDAGARELLLLGGNDLGERAEAGECAYPGGAGDLVSSELDALRKRGVTRVALAGHPDGHPALGNHEGSTTWMLVGKAERLLCAGFDVVVATQFCFDARLLVGWLRRTRQALLLLPGAEGRVFFRLGVPGPTPRKRLERIASICEVPSLFLSSAFDVLDRNNDGFVCLEELKTSLEVVGLARRGTKLHELYVKHAGADGLLGRDEFSKLLAEDALSSRAPSKATPLAHSDRPAASTGASGPSVFVGGGEGKPQSSEEVLPEELVQALAAYCEEEQLGADEVALHFFPFGGLAGTLHLAARLRNGTWPPLTCDPQPQVH